MLTLLSINIGFSYINNNKGMITYVSDDSPEFIYINQEVNGALDGMKDSSFISKKYSDKDPSDSQFNDYLKNYEYMFFSGHGTHDGNAIGSNTPNGFWGQWLYKNDLNNGLQSKVLTLMTCDSMKGFGPKANSKGVKCIVGWDNYLEPTIQKAYDWPYYFYTCTSSQTPYYCNIWASMMSGLSGSVTDGSCNSISMSSLNVNTLSSSIIDSTVLGNKTLENGYVYSKPINNVAISKTNSLNVNEKLSKSDYIKIAEKFLNIKENYKFSSIQELDNNYLIRFERYVDGLRTTFDENVVAINKNSKQIFMHKKTYTPNLYNNYEFVNTKKSIKKLYKDYKIDKIEKVLVKINDEIIPGWIINYNNAGILNSVTISDKTKELI